jgi:hypothetical protein
MAAGMNLLSFCHAKTHGLDFARMQNPGNPPGHQLTEVP